MLAQRDLRKNIRDHMAMAKDSYQEPCCVGDRRTYSSLERTAKRAEKKEKEKGDKI